MWKKPIRLIYNGSNHYMASALKGDTIEMERVKKTAKTQSKLTSSFVNKVADTKSPYTAWHSSNTYGALAKFTDDNDDDDDGDDGDGGVVGKNDSSDSNDSCSDFSDSDKKKPKRKKGKKHTFNMERSDDIYKTENLYNTIKSSHPKKDSTKKMVDSLKSKYCPEKSNEQFLAHGYSLLTQFLPHLVTEKYVNKLHLDVSHLYLMSNFKEVIQDKKLKLYPGITDMNNVILRIRKHAYQIRRAIAGNPAKNSTSDQNFAKHMSD